MVLKTIFKFTQFYKLTWKRKVKQTPCRELGSCTSFFCRQCQAYIDGMVQFPCTALSDIFQNIQCLHTYFYGTVKGLRVAVTKLLMDKAFNLSSVVLVHAD